MKEKSVEQGLTKRIRGEIRVIALAIEYEPITFLGFDTKKKGKRRDFYRCKA